MPIDSTEWFPVYEARMVWIVASRLPAAIERTRIDNPEADIHTLPNQTHLPPTRAVCGQ